MVDSADAELRQRNGQQRAALALGRTGSPRAVEPLLGVLPHATDEDLRVTVVRALGMLGDPRASAPLQAVLENSASESLRTHAVVALASISRSISGFE